VASRGPNFVYLLLSPILVSMGKTAVLFKLLPKDVDIDVEQIASRAKQVEYVKDVKIEPIAFGLKAIKVLVVVTNPEEAESIERKLREIEGIGEVEVEGITLV